MPIDPQELVRQIEAVTPRLQTDFRALEANIADALALYRVAQVQPWVDLVVNSQSAYSLGYPYHDLHQNIPIDITVPPAYTVIATDGSMIPPDRHGGSALYHVINIGRVMLKYGSDSDAAIDSRTLFSAGDVTDDEEQESLSGVLLDMKCKLYELTNGLELAQQHKADLVLVDGPLTLWSSRTQTDQQSNKFRDDYYNLLSAFGERGVPVVGYLSNPYGEGVTNSLRLLRTEVSQPSLFDLEPDFSQSSAASRKPAQRRKGSKPTGFNGVKDALLFRQLLSPNHYSETFKTAFSEPRELASHIGAICFIYLRTETEVIRLEFPEWVAADPRWLPQITRLVRDQFQRGQGYPVALMEAHESAVLRGADRELLRILLEERGLLQPESEKGRSKRLRGI